MIKGLEGYAGWLIESMRIQLGYKANDSSHDDEVEKLLKSGSKISKSKMQSKEVTPCKNVTPATTE